MRVELIDYAGIVAYNADITSIPVSHMNVMAFQTIPTRPFFQRLVRVIVEETSMVHLTGPLWGKSATKGQ